MAKSLCFNIAFFIQKLFKKKKSECGLLLDARRKQTTKLNWNRCQLKTPNLQLSFFQTLCLTPSLVKNIREILLSTSIWKFYWPVLYDLKHERLILLRLMDLSYGNYWVALNWKVINVTMAALNRPNTTSSPLIYSGL